MLKDCFLYTKLCWRKTVNSHFSSFSSGIAIRHSIERLAYSKNKVCLCSGSNLDKVSPKISRQIRFAGTYHGTHPLTLKKATHSYEMSK